MLVMPLSLPVRVRDDSSRHALCHSLSWAFTNIMPLISRIGVLSVAAIQNVYRIFSSNHNILWLWIRAKGAAQSWS
jgi:hypothetical protein